MTSARAALRHLNSSLCRLARSSREATRSSRSQVKLAPAALPPTPLLEWRSPASWCSVGVGFRWGLVSAMLMYGQCGLREVLEAGGGGGVLGCAGLLKFR